MTDDNQQTVIHEINAQIVMGVKALVITIVPLSLAGLALLVSNHYGQQQLKQQVTEMSTTMKITNDRVTIMWMMGGYNEKYREHLLEK